ncbi:MAG: lipopolysaccharide assembly protein LapA domain-containing protein [Acidimicrobiia bacterium]
MTNDSDRTEPGGSGGHEVDVGWLIRATPLALVLALFIVFAIQNAEPVDLEFLNWTFSMRRIFLLVGAAVAGVIVWELGGFFVRRRKARKAAAG